MPRPFKPGASGNPAGRPRGRSHATRAQRVRRLYAGYLSKLDKGDIISRAAARRAAELTEIAEDIRTKIMAGDISLGGELVRIENALDRVARQVAGLAQARPVLSYRERLLQQIAEENEGDGEA